MDPPVHFLGPVGFTLIELLLTLTILALLVGAVAVGVSGEVERHYLDEGSGRVETLMRLARAEAAQRGRTLRLAVGDQGELRVLWEPDPLKKPGVFEAYTESSWAQSLPNEWVRVTASFLDDSEAYQPGTASTALTNDRTMDKQPPGVVTFYPDGSCDSGTMELRSTDAGDDRTAVIEIDGLNAQFTTRVMSPSELEEYRGARDQKKRGTYK